MPLMVIPSIDLREGKVVRLRQGDYEQQLNYDLDPVNVAESFARAGAQWMHIVDLDGAKGGRVVQADQIARVAAAGGLKTSVGGGVRTRDDIDRLLAAGAQRVVVGTKAIEDWNWFAQLAAEHELSGRLILALDAKEGFVVTRGWTQTSALKATELAARVRGWGLAGLLYTDVAKDGMLQGPNLTTTRQLAESTDVPIIASGGVGHLGHIQQLLELPIWGVVVGRSLHEGRLDLAEAIRLASMFSAKV